MLFTGDMVDAQTALDWGLVNRVVPPEKLDAATDELVARIIRSSPHVVALGKRAFYAQEPIDEGHAYALTCGVMVENAQADDAAEGMRAFLEKRPPSWRGA
jgi:enoyl-CoA hydratase/carnithine racemase